MILLMIAIIPVILIFSLTLILYLKGVISKTIFDKTLYLCIAYEILLLVVLLIITNFSTDRVKYDGIHEGTATISVIDDVSKETFTTSDIRIRYALYKEEDKWYKPRTSSKITLLGPAKDSAESKE